MIQAGFCHLLVFLTTLTGLIDNPPEDFLSLANTKAILTNLNIDQSEANLISLLSGNKTITKSKADIDQAVEQLRYGNTKDRKAAKKILNSLGEEYKEYFENLSLDSDPEISETAKNILSRFAAKKQATEEVTITEGVLKILAIRRLTELKSTQALDVINSLKLSRDKDIAKEAERASTLLQNKEVKRNLRNKSTQKLLKLLPENIGFVLALDLTETKKNNSVEDYLEPMKSILDMNIALDRFNQSMPKFLTAIGNPQLDSLVFVISQEYEMTNESTWGGIIARGKFNSDKIRNYFNKRGMLTKKFKGLDYWSQGWGPSFCPVNDEIFIISFGEEVSNHMAKMLANIKGKKIPAIAKEINTQNHRLVAAGKLSQGQKDFMKREFIKDIDQIKTRKNSDATFVTALLKVFILCSSSDSFVGKYADSVLTISAKMNTEEKAKKMIPAIDVLDKEVRKIIQDTKIPFAAIFDVNKSFSKATVREKTVVLEIECDIFDIIPLLMLEFM